MSVFRRHWQHLALVLLAGFVLTMPACTKVGLTAVNASAANGNFVCRKDLAYGDEARQNLDVYSPKTAAGPTPVVVFFYGGTWQSGAKKDYKFMAEALTSLGYTAVIPDYRLYPQVTFPAFVQDGAKALRWTTEHIADFGGDAKNIFVMGHSAGAHIAALLSYDTHYLRAEGLKVDAAIRGFIGLAGPYDFLPIGPSLEKIFDAPQKQKDSQPIAFVTGREPPSLLMYGLKDKTVWPQNIKNLSQKIRDHNGQVQALYYKDMSHVSLVSKFSRLLRRKKLLQDVQGFVEQHLQKKVEK